MTRLHGQLIRGIATASVGIANVADGSELNELPTIGRSAHTLPSRSARLLAAAMSIGAPLDY
jgi:hypothetical protein